jgi:DNA-binding Lrp family transcriptional regulator
MIRPVCRGPLVQITMAHSLDDQEKLILRALVRDPRDSDNAIGQKTGVNVRTVSRKRQRMEEDGILSYYTQINLGATGTDQYPVRQLYTIKFKLGVTYQRLLDDIRREPKVRTVFTECIVESHIAEIDGHLAMLLMVEGESDQELVQTVHEKIIPSLRRNHGDDCIEEVQTVRLLAPVRVMRNYVLPVNMKNGYLVKDWPDEAIYVGR